MNSERFLKALTWTVNEYKDDVRKSSGAPGIHHPLGVADLVMGAGGDEDTTIAALFHDFAEDKGGEVMLSKIRAEFGERVEKIVRDCSDTIPTEYTLKEPWTERKVAHIKHIYHCEQESLLVLSADTLHNARDHVRGFRVNGMDWWKNFRANVYSNKEITPEICMCSVHWYLMNKWFALRNAKINGASDLMLEDLRKCLVELKEIGKATNWWTFYLAEEEILNKYGNIHERN